MRGFLLSTQSKMKTVEALLREELRFMDIDGTVVNIKSIIDRVLERDKGKRRYAVG
jgi:hypothetical protein